MHGYRCEAGSTADYVRGGGHANTGGRRHGFKGSRYCMLLSRRTLPETSRWVIKPDTILDTSLPDDGSSSISSSSSSPSSSSTSSASWSSSSSRFGPASQERRCPGGDCLTLHEKGVEWTHNTTLQNCKTWLPMTRPVCTCACRNEFQFE